jgi:hypothetical protein
MKKLAGHLYLIVLSLWVGGMSLFTFIITPVIFRSYPRDVAGGIVGKLFPSYFLFALLISAAALILFVLAFSEKGPRGYRISLLLASLALITALYINFSLYPEAEKVKREVHSFEAEASGDHARARFRRLHAQSAILNIFMIADGIALLMLNVAIKK